jgi:hypothetical protein
MHSAARGSKVRSVVRSAVVVPVLALCVGGAMTLIGSASAGAASRPAGASPESGTATSTAVAVCEYDSSSSCPPVSDPENFGQSIKVTATVTPTTGIVQPTGTVTFTDVGSTVYGTTGSPATCFPAIPSRVGTTSDTCILGATVPVSAGTVAHTAVATYTGDLAYFGTNSITATYNPTGVFLTSTSSAAAVVIDVDQASVRFGTLVMNEFRQFGPNGDTDNYLDIYDDSTVGQPVPLAGWTITTVGNGTITLPSTAGTLLEGESYLIAGAGYSLGAEQTKNLTSSDLAANSSGVFGYKLAAPDSISTVTDSVGSAGSGGDGNLADLVPPSTAQTADWAWTRQWVGGAPKLTGNNGRDFVLVSNSTADVGAVSGQQAPASLPPTSRTPL